MANRNRFTITKVLIESIQSLSPLISPHIDPFWWQIFLLTLRSAPNTEFVVVFFLQFCEEKKSFSIAKMKLFLCRVRSDRLKNTANWKKSYFTLINNSPFMGRAAQMSLHTTNECRKTITGYKINRLMKWCYKPKRSIFSPLILVAIELGIAVVRLIAVLAFELSYHSYLFFSRSLFFPIYIFILFSSFLFSLLHAHQPQIALTGWSSR